MPSVSAAGTPSTHAEDRNVVDRLKQFGYTLRYAQGEGGARCPPEAERRPVGARVQFEPPAGVPGSQAHWRRDRVRRSAWWGHPPPSPARPDDAGGDGAATPGQRRGRSTL